MGATVQKIMEKIGTIAIFMPKNAAGRKIKLQSAHYQIPTYKIENCANQH